MMIGGGHAACDGNAVEVPRVERSGLFGCDRLVDRLEQRLVSAGILGQFPDHHASGLSKSQLGLLLHGGDAVVADGADLVFGGSGRILGYQAAIR